MKKNFNRPREKFRFKVDPVVNLIKPTEPTNPDDDDDDNDDDDDEEAVSS